MYYINQFEFIYILCSCIIEKYILFIHFCCAGICKTDILLYLYCRDLTGTCTTSTTTSSSSLSAWRCWWWRCRRVCPWPSPCPSPTASRRWWPTTILSDISMLARRWVRMFVFLFYFLILRCMEWSAWSWAANFKLSFLYIFIHFHYSYIL